MGTRKRKHWPLPKLPGLKCLITVGSLPLLARFVVCTRTTSIATLYHS